MTTYHLPLDEETVQALAEGRVPEHLRQTCVEMLQPLYPTVDEHAEYYKTLKWTREQERLRLTQQNVELRRQVAARTGTEG